MIAVTNAEAAIYVHADISLVATVGHAEVAAETLSWEEVAVVSTAMPEDPLC